ncbi:MAG: hypothetical protein E5W72_03425 [Mesorhizobium sp.]|uniref:hypothetical protein n=1 Tax=Mesorhizobium sp. TaxID=1871066 RepID=UPI0011FBE8C2|nr:hypothetical protein [Mesorhizobium sp.]TIT01725.1 MAG: hypothetical protein E5W87_13445 [Mesorhizobium sp.]TIT54560.1 MAG: hypothetical protein E5W72_03425 [Mesorhizobium sp.]
MIIDRQRVKNGLRNTGLRVLVSALLSVPAVVSAADDPSATNFIKTSGTNFALDSRPFFATGVNNHWLDELLMPYAYPRVLGVGGRLEPLWRKPRPWWFLC